MRRAVSVSDLRITLSELSVCALSSSGLRLRFQTNFGDRGFRPMLTLDKHFAGHQNHWKQANPKSKGYPVS